MRACPAIRGVQRAGAINTVWKGWLLAIAALLVVAPCSTADARTAKIVLVVTGDERMQADLKELIEGFEKDQPLSGDSLGLLQGAQAVCLPIILSRRSMPRVG